MSVECPHCGATNFNDDHDDNEERSCYLCGEEFQPGHSSDGMFYDQVEEDHDLTLHHADCTCSACNDEDEDLDDKDLG